MVPFRNLDVKPFEVSLKSLELQTRPFDEILVADYASDEPYKSDIAELCNRYGAKHLYLDVDAPDIVLSVYLWRVIHNHGIRNSTSDFILCTGMDRIYNKYTCECVMDAYNTRAQHGRECMICGKVNNLRRIPNLHEVEDFDKLWEESKHRGGYGVIGASKKWWHKVRGYDETIRWCGDIDIAMRAKFDKLGVLWVTHGRGAGQLEKDCRILHLATHARSIKRFGGAAKQEIAVRGKRFIHRRTGNRIVVRNDENWGIMTEEKLKHGIGLMDLTWEQLKECRAKGIDPLGYNKSLRFWDEV